MALMLMMMAISFKGDMEDEDELLRWLTSEDTLDIPDTIEQINQKMLSKLIENNDFVAVLFSKYVRVGIIFTRIAFMHCHI